MSRQTSFYLLTDTHYVSPRRWVEGRPFTLRERGDQIALKATPQILDAFFEKILADGTTDTVIFTGDNVDDGDLFSHEEFRDRLGRLTAAGKKVYVINATHDYCGAGDDENGFSAARYTETGTEPIPFMRKSELLDYYFDYGPKQALSLHRESRSYAVQLCDGVRLVMIDDNGNGRSHCGLFEDGVQWLTEQIRAAKDAGDFVLLATHHPVLPPWDIFAKAAEHELYGGYRDLWDLMCAENVRVVFTGHTHVQNIREYQDGEGRFFYNVATIAIANAAGKMRRVTVDADAGTCDVKSVGIEHIDLPGAEGKTAYELLYPINFPGIVERLLPLVKTDYDAFLDLAEGFLPVDQLKKHKTAVKALVGKLMKMKLSTAAKFGGAWRSLSPEQRRQAKEEPLIGVVYEILRHIYTGNAPYGPETAENIALTGVVRRVDGLVRKFRIAAVQNLIPEGSSLVEVARGFLYNDRTGDDDSICISLK